MRTSPDLTGQRFGKLVCLERAGSSVHKKALWRCKCDCGQESIAVGSGIRNGNTKSCGCGNRLSNLSHGATIIGSPVLYLYNAMRNARSRCNNPNDPDYHNYGAVGIRWEFDSFEQFADEIGPRPDSSYSIDRKDTSKGYAPRNMRWATKTQQSINQKLSSANTSGFRGVSRRDDRWQVNITYQNRQFYFGTFCTPLEAAREYDKRARELHGADAVLNFPDKVDS